MSLRFIHSVERVEQVLMERILAGDFAEAPLPSQQDLADEFGVSRHTVGSAIGRLSARGLCSTWPGVRTAAVPLVHSLDQKHALKLIKQAKDLTRAIQLLEDLLALVRQMLCDAAAAAASKRKQVHLDALRTVAEEVRLRSTTDAATLTGVEEYSVWRIVTGGASNLGATTALNALRALWDDPDVLKASAPVELAHVEALTAAITAGDAEAARAAAGRILEVREKLARGVAAAAEASPTPTAAA